MSDGQSPQHDDTLMQGTTREMLCVEVCYVCLACHLCEQVGDEVRSQWMVGGQRAAARIIGGEVGHRSG